MSRTYTAIAHRRAPGEGFAARELPRMIEGARRVFRMEADHPRNDHDSMSIARHFAEVTDPMLLWVSPDMRDLAADAAATLPEVHLGTDLWPSEQGLLALGAPILIPGFGKADERGDIQPVRAIVWSRTATTAAVFLLDDFETWMDEEAERRSMSAESFDTLMTEVLAMTDGAHPRVIALGSAVYPTDRVLDPQDPDIPHMAPAAFLSSLFLLMAQDGIATQRVERAQPREARRARRAGRGVPDVRIIEIRSGSASAAAYSGTSREYRHRWVVRGHWRRQWVPSLGIHRPTYIAPYVKGPADAPLLTGTKVHVWQGR